MTNLKMHKQHRNITESVDYDAIMESIKIAQTPSFAFTNLRPIGLQTCDPYNQTFRKNNYMYDSIVHDNLEHDSCFQSLFRNLDTNNFKITTKSKVLQYKTSNQVGQFMFYEPFQPVSVSEMRVTPKKGQIQSKINKIIPIISNDENKENAGCAHNMLQKRQPQLRYLSHTKTSQKKIKAKKIGTITPHLDKTTEFVKRTENSAGKYKKETRKAGIELIKQKYYHS